MSNSQGKKTLKPSGQEQVMAYLNDLVHPLKAEIEYVRKLILEANGQLTENIKWNAPNFRFNDQDRITMNLHGKDGFRLIFHCGSQATKYAKGNPIYTDSTQLLEWLSGDRATVTLKSMQDIVANEARLKLCVNEWIAATKDLN